MMSASVGSPGVPNGEETFSFKDDLPLYPEYKESSGTKHSRANTQDACAKCRRMNPLSPHVPGS